MTDKQIKIDGIDVSKCKYIDIDFEKPICHCISQRNECEMPCEYNKDCYYKQLKRKEEECEELKQTLTEIKEIAETATKCFYATKSDDYTDGYRWLGNKILQKISECEVKNENIRNL